MKYYKTLNDDVMAIGEDADIEGDQSELVKEEWVLLTDEEYNAFLNPSKTREEIKEEYSAAIQNMLDSKAKELGYDNIISACSYAGYQNEFQDESILLGMWRSSVWSKTYAIFADADSSLRELPTIDSMLIELPKF